MKRYYFIQRVCMVVRMEAKTMIKAEVGERVNEAINQIRDETEMNKAEAAAYVLRKGVDNLSSEVLDE